MHSVIPVLAFRDNYIWLLTTNTHQACCVDPGDAEPVLEVLQKQQLTLTTILITHHHADHIGGVETLRQHFPNCQVIGPSYRNSANFDVCVSDGDKIMLDQFGTFVIIHTPGHTLDHITYYQAEHGMIFCGDTLFSAGCGRIFEGTFSQLLTSVTKLAALPGQSLIYPAHEYTEQNVKFALNYDINNQHLKDFGKMIAQLRCQQLPTLPSTIGEQLRINPFLRCANASLQDSLATQIHATVDDELTAFTYLRQLKDKF